MKLFNMKSLSEAILELTKDSPRMTPFEIETDPLCGEALEEYFSYNDELQEEYSLSDLKAGDLVLVNTFNNVTDNMTVNGGHQAIIFYVDRKNNINKNSYFGFALSSRVEKSNKKNPKFMSNIYIDDYNSILTSNSIKLDGKKEVMLNLRAVDEFSHAAIIKKIGAVTPEFFNFIKETKEILNKKDYTKPITWENR